MTSWTKSIKWTSNDERKAGESGGELPNTLETFDSAEQKMSPTQAVVSSLADLKDWVERLVIVNREGKKDNFCLHSEISLCFCKAETQHKVHKRQNRPGKRIILGDARE